MFIYCIVYLLVCLPNALLHTFLFPYWLVYLLAFSCRIVHLQPSHHYWLTFFFNCLSYCLVYIPHCLPTECLAYWTIYLLICSPTFLLSYWFFYILTSLQTDLFIYYWMSYLDPDSFTYCLAYLKPCYLRMCLPTVLFTYFLVNILICLFTDLFAYWLYLLLTLLPTGLVTYWSLHLLICLRTYLFIYYLVYILLTRWSTDWFTYWLVYLPLVCLPVDLFSNRHTVIYHNLLILYLLYLVPYLPSVLFVYLLTYWLVLMNTSF